MLCAHPYRPAESVEYPCGKCKACLVNRRRMWTARIVLESMAHQHNCFLTLTVADVPRGHHGSPRREAWEVMPALLRGFIKSLRRAGYRVRYYGCGEYGDMGGRPHYHVVLFGLPPVDAEFYKRHWEYGEVHVGQLTKQSAQYVAGYVCKKISSTSIFGNRCPEFARMSRRPGLGHSAIGAIAASFNASSVRDGAVDVPASVRVSGSVLPIGQYARRLARVACGMDSKMSQEARLQLAAEYAAMPKDERERRRQNAYESLLQRLKIEKSRRVL